ncbi:MAG: hypothetical protein NTY53_00515 [Kiritimatiellaeota bacterium]|nr:hypothetical protein [Kiritimatiellota bacterium]
MIGDGRDALRERDIELRQDELALDLGVHRGVEQRDLDQVVRVQHFARDADFLRHEADGGDAAALAVAAVLHLHRGLIDETAADRYRARKARHAAATLFGGAHHGPALEFLGAIHLRTRFQNFFREVFNRQPTPSSDI